MTWGGWESWQMATEKLCQGDSEKCRGPKHFSACPPVPHAQPFLPAVTLSGGEGWGVQTGSSALPRPHPSAQGLAGSVGRGWPGSCLAPSNSDVTPNTGCFSLKFSGSSPGRFLRPLYSGMGGGHGALDLEAPPSLGGGSPPFLCTRSL